MSAGSLLEVSDLRVSFRVGGLSARLAGRATEIEAVSGVSFSLDRGSTFALVGESGSGKTTLARALNGLQPAVAGSIRFDGQELRGLSNAGMKPIRQRMPMMFQDPVGSLSPRLSVRSLLTEPFAIHGLSNRDLDAEVRRRDDRRQRLRSQRQSDVGGGVTHRRGDAIAKRPGRVDRAERAVAAARCRKQRVGTVERVGAAERDDLQRAGQRRRAGDVDPVGNRTLNLGLVGRARSQGQVAADRHRSRRIARSEGPVDRQRGHDARTADRRARSNRHAR